MTYIKPHTREFLDNLVKNHEATGRISTEDLQWLVATIEKTDQLMVAVADFVDIAHASVQDLEKEVADRDATIEGISRELDEVLRLQSEESTHG